MTADGQVFYVSTHAPRTGCDIPNGEKLSKFSWFQPTHPVRGATAPGGVSTYVRWFQPTHPVRGATQDGQVPGGQEVVSTHAPRTGCDDVVPEDDPAAVVSTHAPRTGCDESCSSRPSPPNCFNPRTPYGVRQGTQKRIRPHPGEFQPTHPVRGATAVGGQRRHLGHVSTHAPRTGCDEVLLRGKGSAVVSTHAPRTGCDLNVSPMMETFVLVSTHAPRTGCDGQNTAG